MVNIAQVKQLAITKRHEGPWVTPAEKPRSSDENYLSGCHGEWLSARRPSRAWFPTSPEDQLGGDIGDARERAMWPWAATGTPRAGPGPELRSDDQRVVSVASEEQTKLASIAKARPLWRADCGTWRACRRLLRVRRACLRCAGSCCDRRARHGPGALQCAVAPGRAPDQCRRTRSRSRGEGRAEGHQLCRSFPAHVGG